MKRWITGMLSAAVAVLALSGCALGKRQVNDSLTVWIMDPALKVNYERAVEEFEKAHPGVQVQFAEMPEPVFFGEGSEQEYISYWNEVLPQYHERMRNEILMGKGPDVVLFDMNTFPDLYKTVMAGAFCDLNAFVESDATYLCGVDGEPGSFRENVLDGGMIDGKRYFFPLFYNLPGITAPRANLERYALRLEDPMPYLEVMEELAKTAENDAPIPLLGYTSTPAGAYVGLAEAVTFHYREKRVDIDEERLKRLIEANKRCLELPQYNDWEESMERVESGRALLCLEGNMEDLLYESSIINTFGEPQALPYRDADGGIRAQIALAGAVNNASVNQQNAYDFLMLCLQFYAQTMPGGWRGTPVNLGNYAVWLDIQKQRNETIQADGYIAVSQRQLPNEFYEKVNQWNNEITGVIIDMGLDERIWEWFLPYYRGRSSYEACRDAMENELKIYISE